MHTITVTCYHAVQLSMVNLLNTKEVAIKDQSKFRKPCNNLTTNHIQICSYIHMYG